MKKYYVRFDNQERGKGSIVSFAGDLTEAWKHFKSQAEKRGLKLMDLWTED